MFKNIILPDNAKISLFSSICEVSIVHPIDVYKTLYQQDHNFSIKKFLKTDFKFKYRGFLTRSMGIIPMRTTFWTANSFAENNFKNTNNLYFNYIRNGSFVSFFQTLIDCPIENLKIRAINNSTQYKGKLYNGFISNYLRNTIFAASVFGFNGYAEKNNYNRFVFGGLGGFLGSVTSQPIDYLKTLKQSKNYKYWNIISDPSHVKKSFNGWLPRASMGFITMGIGSFIISLLS